MNSKTFVVTGASGAIGAEVCKALLQRGHGVIMACRNLKKGERILDSIVENKDQAGLIKLMKLDMSSFESVRNFADDLKIKNIPIDGLINNAATMQRHFSVTKDALETTIQVNYISVFLLNKLLMPLFSENAAIVNVVSIAKKANKLNKSFFQASEKDFSQTGNYLLSKTALTIHTAHLAQQTEGKYRVNAIDPGIVDSNIITMNRWFDPLANLVFRPFTKTPKAGAKPVLNALFSTQSGQLFAGKKHKAINDKYKEHSLKEWLWNETKKVVKSAQIVE